MTRWRYWQKASLWKLMTCSKKGKSRRLVSIHWPMPPHPWLMRPRWFVFCNASTMIFVMPSGSPTGYNTIHANAPPSQCVKPQSSFNFYWYKSMISCNIFWKWKCVYQLMMFLCSTWINWWGDCFVSSGEKISKVCSASIGSAQWCGLGHPISIPLWHIGANSMAGECSDHAQDEVRKTLTRLPKPI